MKKLLVLVIIGFAVWQAKLHYGDLLHRKQSHEAVIDNRSGRTIVKMRITVGGQTLVKEEIASGEKATLPFNVNQDSAFHLDWEWKDSVEEKSWGGGMVPKGPMVQRHVFQILDDGAVLYNVENLSGSS